MKRARASFVHPVVVVDTVCNVAVLLGLQYEGAPFYGAKSTRLDLEEIAFFNRDLPQKFRPPFLLYHLFYFFFILCTVADDNGSVFVAVQHVPAFGFSKGAVFVFHCIGIVRMDLDA